MTKIKKITFLIIAMIFLAVMAIFMVQGVKNDSATTDEPIHVLSGYEYWRGRFSVNPEHPPLGKQIATISLNFILPVMPLDEKYEKAISDFHYDSWQETRAYAQKWLFETPGNNAEKIVNSARFMVVVFAILLGILIFFVARKWYGLLTATIAVFLYSFSPLILTHGHLANTDLWMTLGFFMSVFSFFYYLEKPNWFRLVLTAVCFASAMLLKFSAALLVPILIILWLVYRYKSRDRSKYGIKNFILLLITFLLITSFLIWADYGFPLHTAPKIIAQADFIYTNKPLQILAPILGYLPIPEYFKGLIMVLATSVSERSAYLLGHFSDGGWWYYFPVAFLAKEPLAFIVTILAGAGFWIFGRRKMKFHDWLLIIPPAFYVLATLSSKLNIGLRHLMPIYPFLFIFAGYFISELLVRYKKSLTSYYLLLATLAVFALWYLSASILVFPTFMAYFNELSGGPRNGPNILADSNIDWGQDMKRLSEWLDNHHITEPVHMEYFWGGSYQADYYGVKYIKLEENDSSQRGWVVIGVSALGRPGFAWVKQYQPVDRIGYSVYIYKIN